MTENDRQTMNIKNKVQEFDDGVISAEALVGYMLDHEFIYDTFASDAVEDEDDANWDEDEDDDIKTHAADTKEVWGEGQSFTFDKFLDEAPRQRVIGTVEDSAVRERARRHQERPINRIRWG